MWIKNKEFNLKITDEKFENKLHIYAIGKGKYAEIRIKSTMGADKCSLNDDYELEEAKEIVKYLNIAIENLEKRMKIPEEE